MIFFAVQNPARWVMLLYMTRQIILTVAGMFFILAGLLSAFIILIAGLPTVYLAVTAVTALTGIACMVANAVGSYRSFSTPKNGAAPGTVIDATRPSSILERNNNLINDWKKVQETRGKLKMLKIAAESEEDNAGS